MRRNLISTIVPSILAILGLVSVVWWMGQGPLVPLQARVPGLDRPQAGVAVEKVPLQGKLSVLDAAQPPALPGGWPQFRGPQLDGICHDDVRLARRWPQGGPRVLWSVELGEGYAAAAIHASRVYVLDYDREAAADVLRCFSLDAGRELWRFSYPVVIKRNHGMSRTIPAVTDDFLVTLGPKCHALCLHPLTGTPGDTGQPYWLIDLVEQYGAKVPEWYAGQCPLIDQGKLILAPGGEALLVALDCRTGQPIWKSDNPQGWTMTHTSVVPMEFAGRRTYVYCGKGGVAGVAADDGRILWSTTDWKISIATVPSPVVLPDGKIFFCGGYNAGSLLLQLQTEGDKIVPRTLKRMKAGEFGSTQQTPIFYEGHLYGVREKDKQLVCLDLEGKVLWASGSQHRFGLGPYLIADKLLYVLDDSGKLTMAEATPQGYRPLDQAQVLDGHDAWGPMAMAAGRLILRDMTRMVCLDVSQK